MKPGIASDTKKSGKSLAQKIARQVAQEPFEILKEAGREVTGTQEPTRAEDTHSQEEIKLREAKDKAQSKRQIDALAKELKDIQTISEQKAQEKAAPEPEKAVKPVVEPTTKRSRRFLGIGPKTQAERQKTRVEKILPPSG
jgi:hypothetical protein